jgi:rod shape-determining protein MreD
MFKKETMKYYLPVILFFCMLLDSHLSRFLQSVTNGAYVPNAHFLILILLCCSLTFSKRYLLTATIILGIVFDMYYIGVVGIYAVAIPLTVLLMYALSHVIHTNVFTEFFSMIIFVTGFELFTLGIQLIFRLVTVNTTYFITQFLGPTLLLNMIIFALFIFPFKKIFVDKIKNE